MQIDFHFGCIYLLSRLAGFKSPVALTIARSSQFVDDCKQRGVRIVLKDENVFSPITTAHKFISRENLRLENQISTLLPFHFLPSGGTGSYLESSLVHTNSPLADHLWKQVKESAHQPFSPHLLGIFLHAYADMWAHDGFCAFLSGWNRVRSSSPSLESDRLLHRLKHSASLGKITRNFIKHILRRYSRGTFTVGHFEASRRPDIPWLTWEYMNHHQERVFRNNPVIFLQAASNLFERLTEFLILHPESRDEAVISREWSQIEEDIRELLLTGHETREEDAEKRLEAWIDASRNGRFKFKDEGVYYNEREWFEEAVFKGDSGLRAREGFMMSDWKLFQDAARLHRDCVLKEFCGGVYSSI